MKLKLIWNKIRPYLETIIIIIISVQSFVWFGAWGIFGVLFVILLMVGLRLFANKSNRDLFIYQLGKIETVMWGKPLDKRNWKKGEINQIKLKPQWRKKNDGKTKGNNEIYNGK